MSNPQQIKLIDLGIQYYAGISKDTKPEIVYPEGVDITEVMKEVDPEQGILIVFPGGYNYIQAEADQGAGKTSWINCIMEAVGSMLPSNAINSNYNEKKFNFKIIGLDGFLYNIRGTKSTYVIEKIEIDEHGEVVLNEKGRPIKSIMGEPKTFIKKIVGPTGISPQWLRDMKPEEQVAWLRSLYTLTKEQLVEEKRIRTEYDKAYKSRTEAGNDKKKYLALRNASPYYSDWVKWEEYFKETKHDKVEEDAEKYQVAYSEYTGIEQSLKNAKEIFLVREQQAVTDVDTEIEATKREIQRLQEKLTNLHDDKDAKVKIVNERNDKISKAETWLTENITKKEDWENFSTKLKEATEFKNDKQKWDALVVNKNQVDHYETEYQRLTSLVDGLALAKQQFTELFSPKIEGLEICIPGEDEKRQGLFYFKKSLDQLAESELWELATHIWAELKVQMIFVENINSLGSGAIEMFNKFIQQGGYVFGTLMNRTEKNLKISIESKIPE